jgi:AcrR family transcriptional regulator
VRFGSKEGLLLALVDKWVDEWSEVRVLPTLGDSTGASALGIVIEALRASARRDPTRLRALYILMFEAVIGADVLMKRMQQEHERQFGLYRDMIQRGIDSGTVRASIDASEMAYLVITLIRGTAYQWLLNEAFDLDAALVSTIAVIHNLLDP